MECSSRDVRRRGRRSSRLREESTPKVEGARPRSNRAIAARALQEEIVGVHKRIAAKQCDGSKIAQSESAMAKAKAPCRRAGGPTASR